MTAPRKDVIKYVDPLPKEYYDEEDRFQRDVIDRASEMPPDEYRRLVDEYYEKQGPYLKMMGKAMMEHLGAMVGIDPEEFKKPAGPPGFLGDYFGPGFDPVAAVRAVRGCAP